MSNSARHKLLRKVRAGQKTKENRVKRNAGRMKSVHGGPRLVNRDDRLKQRRFSEKETPAQKSNPSRAEKAT